MKKVKNMKNVRKIIQKNRKKSQQKKDSPTSRKK